MKTILIVPLLSAIVANAGVVITTTVDFNNLTSNSILGTSYTENGITFSSPSNLLPITGYLTNDLIGWGAGIDTTPAVSVVNNSWLTVSAGGELINDISFIYGFGWDGYSIELGITVPVFNWQAWNGDQLVSYGSNINPPHFHSGGFTLHDDVGFDRLLVSSTALQYQAVYNGTPWPVVGPLISNIDLNTIAIDNVHVVYDPPGDASAPDSSSTGVLLLISFLPPIARRALLRLKRLAD